MEEEGCADRKAPNNRHERRLSAGKSWQYRRLRLPKESNLVPCHRLLSVGGITSPRRRKEKTSFHEPRNNVRESRESEHDESLTFKRQTSPHLSRSHLSLGLGRRSKGVMQSSINVDGSHYPSERLSESRSSTPLKELQSNNDAKNLGWMQNDQSLSNNVQSNVDELVDNLKEILQNDIEHGETQSLKWLRERLADHSIQHRRKKDSLDALREWKKSHSVTVVSSLANEARRQIALRNHITAFRKNVANRMIAKCFAGWIVHTETSRFDSVSASRKADDFAFFRLIRLVRIAMCQWRSVAIGLSSRKNIVAAHRKQLIEARTILTEKLRGRGEDILAITNEMVWEEARRCIVSKMDLRRSKRTVGSVFNAFKSQTLAARSQMVAARRHHRRATLKRVISHWSDWSALRTVGLDNIPRPRQPRMEVRYNQRVVDAFAERRLLRLGFRLWRPVAARLAKSKRMRRRILSSLLLRHFLAWRDLTRKNRRLLSDAASRWKEYKAYLVRPPLREWSRWTRYRQKAVGCQGRLLQTYLRCKSRKIAWAAFRQWRHQAVYGRISGLYSRQQMMSALEEQRNHCRRMEIEVARAAETVVDVTSELEKKDGLVSLMRHKVEVKDARADEMEMAVHNAEQELTRMQSLVDCVARLHPTVTGHLIKMQKEFGFKERALEPLIRMKNREELDWNYPSDSTVEERDKSRRDTDDDTDADESVSMGTSDDSDDACREGQGDHDAENQRCVTFGELKSGLARTIPSRRPMSVEERLLARFDEARRRVDALDGSDDGSSRPAEGPTVNLYSGMGRLPSAKCREWEGEDEPCIASNPEQAR